MRHVFKATKMGWGKEKEGIYFDAKYYTKEEAMAEFKPFQGTTQKGYPYTGYEYDGQKYHDVATPSAQRIAHPGENAARFPSFHRGHFRSAQRHGQEPQDAADDQEEHQLESRRRKRRVLVYRHHHGSRDGEESEERQRAFERRPAHRAHRARVSRRRLRCATSIAHAASTPFLT